MNEATAKLVGAAIGSAVVAGLGGFVGSGDLDTTGARAWQQEEAQKIAESDRIRARVRALEAQQEILLELVGRCGQ